ncbi:CinA family protein [Kocuria coralli]|uniref:CinA family protein n=1 Tax=Kocuria coralli TaxID=1461025 RepID=A0A5J5KVK1_9MICC|nr:CinA family protein [Kocuria coralli]KAA9393604.1 CinA family protein [Kocuria coralli]
MRSNERLGGEDEFEAAEEAISAAVAARLSIGTAESLTGGKVAAALVAVPGASAVFEGGVVSYSHGVKTRVLGVPAALLERTGAVDPQVAALMAEGAREALGVGIGVSTTGVAGPEPHDGKPVGTVYIGVAGPRGTRTVGLELHGDRDEIRTSTVVAALRELTAYCGLSEISQ